MAPTYPSRIDIPVWGYWEGTANSTPNRYQSSSALGMGILYPNGFGSASNEIHWKVALRSGTWTLTLIYDRPGTVNGIATMKLDSSTIGTIDMDVGSGWNVVGTISDFTIANDGVYTLKFTTPTTNTTEHYYEIHHITLQRTGPANAPTLGISPVLWLDASDAATITASGGAVSAWEDKINGTVLAQSDGSHKPTTGSVTINGLNALAFDGSDYLEVDLTADPLGVVSEALSVYYVFSDVDSGGSTYRALPLTFSNNNAGAPLDGYNTARIIGGNSSTGFTDIAAVTDPTVLVEEVHRTGSGSDTLVTEYRDGTLVHETTLSGWDCSNQYLSAGSREDHVTGFPGRVGEILVYPAVLDTASREAVEAYLSTKWGIT